MELAGRLRSVWQLIPGHAEVKPSDTTLLLTRPRPASERFAAELEAALGPFRRTIVSPVLRIVPTDRFPEVPDRAALAFTSENAVAIAAASMPPAGRVAYCVGDRTAAAAREAGFDAVSAEGDAVALADLIVTRPPGAEIVHLGGAHQRGDLVERLAGAGLPARRLAIYDQAPAELDAAARSALAGECAVIVPLFSPRSAELLSGQACGARAPLYIAALSPAVATAWSGPAPVALAVADHPQASALVAATGRLLAAAPGA
jgi:uroporphyrinogen-III synthase